ncbi:phosphodiester glycosidase family protein [Bacillus sp. CGMCC 1.16607]|uniref:phosphodiester glycosidase family protein n=1 Tax=Bacillus sp. CGMCC 1.16607 TaxID=3351842 RepID=UPI00362B99D1
MKKLIVSMTLLCLVFSQAFSTVGTVHAATSSSSEQQLTPGIKLVKRSTTVSDKSQTIHTVDIDLQDPYTTIDYGVSNPINKVSSVTELSKTNTVENHHVVGAVNASFFNMSTGAPAYLLAKNNQIESLGAVSNLNNDFMFTPAAFGIDKNKQGLIDKFNLNIAVTHNNKTVQIDSFNRNRNTNESILYTSGFRFGETRTSPMGLEVVVKKLDKPLDPGATFGDTISGVVTEIRPYGRESSTVIPKDGFVLSAHGTKVAQIRDMKVGDPVSIKIDVEEKWKDASFMLASGPLLVQGGKVNMTIDPASPRATQRTARTAVAVDSTKNKVFFVTVDGRTPGYSEGMTLKEFATYLVSLGAYQAINLDGGGSTTLAARIPGSRYASLINKPQDGVQRKVSAILQAVSNAPYGDAVSFKAAQSIEGKLAIGASVDFTITDALDSYNNLIPINYEKVQLTADGIIGKIENNKFVALSEGTTTVGVKFGTTEVKVPVTVVASPSKFEIAPSELFIGKDEQQKVTANAFDVDGKPVIFNSTNITWAVTGDIGTIDPDGTFRSASKDGTGTITGTLGSKTVTIPVTVSNQPRLISGFESAAEWNSESIRSETTLAFNTVQKPKQGKSSLKLSYNFIGNKKDTTASYAVAAKRIPLGGKPVAIGLWVYGDGGNHWLRGRLYDAAGKELTVNFTEDGGLNWVGWKYVQATIPTTVKYPLSFDRVYIAEPNVAKQNKGSIYLDKLQAVYELPNQEKYFVTDTKTPIVNVNKKWTVTFNAELNPATVNNTNIYVEDLEGNRLPVTVTPGTEPMTVFIEAPLGGYEIGKEYQIVVTEFVRSTRDKPVQKDFYWAFKVK